MSVQIAQRWVLAALRHRTFFTLADLNAAIRDARRRDQRPADEDRRRQPARALRAARSARAPARCRATRYELAEWKPCRVNIDYHVEVDHNFYSVPYQLVHARVEARVTAATVEVFFKGRRVAVACARSPAAAGLPRRSRTCRARIARTPNGRRRA